MNPIYLDHNSTTPVHPAVIDAMRPFWCVCFGNPASAHRVGQHARRALEAARESIAARLNAESAQVLFTSGGTEANNLAIFGLAPSSSGHVLASPIEHPSVAEPLKQLARRGSEVEYLRVTHSGLLDETALDGTLTEAVRLVTLMLVNNETGAVQPVQGVASRLPSNATFHCDAVQAVGKMPVSFRELGVSTLSLSGHKFGGPRGIGALIVRKGVRLTPLVFGGHQQQGLRPGTEPVALAVGMAQALELACESLSLRQQHVQQLRTLMLAGLQKSASPLVVNGPLDALPYTLNVSFPGCRADTLLINLDLAGVACSTGSACSSGSLLPSPTLQAMNCPPDVLGSAMRFSFSPEQSTDEIQQAAQIVGSCVQSLRARSAE
jgi:cysteine desulfurase